MAQNKPFDFAQDETGKRLGMTLYSHLERKLGDCKEHTGFGQRVCADASGKASDDYNGPKTVYIYDKRGQAIKAEAGSCAKFINAGGSKLTQPQTKFVLSVGCINQSCKQLKISGYCN